MITLSKKDATLARIFANELQSARAWLRCGDAENVATAKTRIACAESIAMLYASGLSNLVEYKLFMAAVLRDEVTA